MLDKRRSDLDSKRSTFVLRPFWLATEFSRPRAVGLQGNRRRFWLADFVELPHTQIANQGLVTFSYVNGLLRFVTMPEMQNGQLDLVAFLYGLEAPHFSFMKHVAVAFVGVLQSRM